MKRFIHRCLVGLAAFALLAHSHAFAQPAVGGASFGVPRPLEANEFNTSPVSVVRPVSFAVQGTTSTFAVPEFAAGHSRRIPLAVFWEDGLRFESNNDRFHLHLGGTIQVDSTWLIGPSSVFALPNGSANGVGNASANSAASLWFTRRA